MRKFAWQRERGVPHVLVSYQDARPHQETESGASREPAELSLTPSSFLTVGPRVRMQDLAPVESIHFHGRNAGQKLDVWDLDR